MRILVSLTPGNRKQVERLHQMSLAHARAVDDIACLSGVRFPSYWFTSRFRIGPIDAC